MYRLTPVCTHMCFGEKVNGEKWIDMLEHHGSTLCMFFYVKVKYTEEVSLGKSASISNMYKYQGYTDIMDMKKTYLPVCVRTAQ